MSIGRLLLPLIFFVFLSANVSAQIIYLGVDNQISSDNSVHSTITVTFQHTNYTKFLLPVFFNIQNLKFSANFDKVNCKAEKKSYGTDIICDISLTKEKRQLNIEFDTYDLIKRLNGVLLFKQEFYVPLNTTTLSFKVLLPEGMALIENHTVFQPYTPLNGEKGTDGRRIFISWRRENIISGEVFNSQVAYESTTDYYSELIALFTGSLIGLMVVIIFLTIGIWYFIKKRRDVKLVLPVLKKDEKVIMEILMKYKGKTNQKTLVKESNYSKAKVSKVLKSLEERGLVKLERIGRMNKVFLTENYEKKKR